MTLLGHPAGLFLLFLVEMWERFSYYGMRGLLVLYLVQSTHPRPDPTGFVNPGRGWSRGDASLLYGWYPGLAYLLPIVGGWIADRLLGTHRSMVIGGLLIALGHLVLAVSGVGSLARTDAGMSVFVFGLALIVIGTGHFKPCVSVMVGQLYAPGDARRDGAFTIFYMGINLGAFLSAFVCGTLGERVGWHWGFGSAAVGMLAGLALYVALRQRLLGDIGRPPAGPSHLAVRCGLRARARTRGRPSRATREARARPRLLGPGLRLHGGGRPRPRRSGREGIDGVRPRPLLLAHGGRALPLADGPLLRDAGRARALRLVPHGRVVHLDLPREPGRRARRIAGRGDRVRRDRAPVASGRTGGLLHALRGVGRPCRGAHLPPGSATRPARARGRLTLRLAGGRGCSAGRCGRPRARAGSGASAARRSTGCRGRRAREHCPAASR